MAREAVTIVSASVERVIRIGNTNAITNWADGAVYYTVPPGKVLTLKSQILGGYSASGIFGVQLGSTNEERTIVLTAGMVIHASASASTFFASGYLSDAV